MASKLPLPWLFVLALGVTLAGGGAYADAGNAAARVGGGIGGSH